VTARELVLTYERHTWRARGAGIDLVHADLRALDALVAARLASDVPVDVRLTFDMATLPRGLHQYHAHYCNYTLRVPERGSP
jgi:hypothetical protein